MPSKPNMIASLRGKHDPHYKLAGRVEGLEKDLPRQLNQLHKTLSKSFGMQRKTLMRVLGLEKKGAELSCPKYIEARRLYRKNHLDRLDFFHSNFHKLSRRILESLVKYGVDRLVLAKNLCFAKNTDTKTMGKKNNQRFYQLPIGKLIHYLEIKAPEYGIHIEFIDEAYTSKCSVLNLSLIHI